STDKFHDKHARIYQVASKDPFRGTGGIPFVLKSFSDYAVTNYPEVEAAPKDVLQLVTLSFAKRVAVAFVIAVPVGYYLMNKWLSGFVKKIDLGPEIFIMSAVIMTIVSAITLSFQTLQAVFTNPVQELRSDGE